MISSILSQLTQQRCGVQQGNYSGQKGRGRCFRTSSDIWVLSTEHSGGGDKIRGLQIILAPIVLTGRRHADLKGKHVDNILPPKSEQNAEWFQSSFKALFNYNIFQEWRSTKINATATSFEGFVNKLHTKWGVECRDVKQVAPPKISIPRRKTAKLAATSTGAANLRYGLNEK